MKWRQKGFTLIEVVLALSTLLMIIQLFNAGQQQFSRRSKLFNSTAEWFLMLRELERPEHDFSAKKISGEGALNFMAKGRNIDLIKDGHKLVLLYEGYGNEIQLMTHVKHFTITPELLLTVYTTENQVFKAHLLLPKRGPS